MFVTMSLTSFVYKINTKLEDKGFQCLLFFMSYWHINEKNCQVANANTQKPQWLKGKTCTLCINGDKGHPQFEPQLL